MLVGVGDPSIILFFEGILSRIGVWIAPLPELLDELFALFVGLKMDESAAFFRGNDVNHVFVQPLLILGIEFFEEVFVALGLLLGRLFRGFLVGRSARGILGESARRTRQASG